jgi:hypothetical protein
MTITIELPDTAKDIVAALSTLIKDAGGSISVDDDNLSQAEFDLLQESYREALLIKKGAVKGIPASDLWND